MSERLDTATSIAEQITTSEEEYTTLKLEHAATKLAYNLHLHQTAIAWMETAAR